VAKATTTTWSATAWASALKEFKIIKIRNIHILFLKILIFEIKNENLGLGLTSNTIATTTAAGINFLTEFEEKKE
jgi:hypothetical protein